MRCSAEASFGKIPTTRVRRLGLGVDLFERIVRPDLRPMALRRGREVGGLGPDGELAAWAASMHEGRHTADLLGAAEFDDVADPMGGSWEDFEEMGRTLWGIAHGLADLIWPAR